MQEGSEYVLTPKNVTFFHSILLLDNCKFHIINDERLLSEMEGKNNFLRHLKQFDGLTWLTLSPYFTTDLCHWLETMRFKLCIAVNLQLYAAVLNKNKKMTKQHNRQKLRTILKRAHMRKNITMAKIPRIPNYISVSCDAWIQIVITMTELIRINYPVNLLK